MSDPAKKSNPGWAPCVTDASPYWEGHYPHEDARRGRVVEVVIPTILCSDLLPATIELIRRQSGDVRPYFVIIDTGSPADEQQRVLDMQADDLEVHLLRSGGYPHASDPVAVALDLALSMCRSEVQVLTHADCFLNRRDALADLVAKVSATSPVVGYQISPRPGIKDWEHMIGHTWSALHVPTIRRLGMSWSHGASVDKRTVKRGNSWDTEYGFCTQMWRNGIHPTLIGTEQNYERNTNADFDHIRSLPGSRLAKGKHLAKAESWITDAMQHADERITAWSP